MADIFTTGKRSQIMSRIRSNGTQPEIVLFQLLKGLLRKNMRINKYVRTLPGQPDFVIPSLRLAIFMDGCFYHGCPKHGHDPKSNRNYWVPKLARNLARDKANRKALRMMGFGVWKIWEHSLKGPHCDHTREILAKRLRKRMATRR